MNPRREVTQPHHKAGNKRESRRSAARGHTPGVSALNQKAAVRCVHRDTLAEDVPSRRIDQAALARSDRCQPKIFRELSECHSPRGLGDSGPLFDRRDRPWGRRTASAVVRGRRAFFLVAAGVITAATGGCRGRTILPRREHERTRASEHPEKCAEAAEHGSKMEVSSCAANENSNVGLFRHFVNPATAGTWRGAETRESRGTNASCEVVRCRRPGPAK